MCMVTWDDVIQAAGTWLTDVENAWLSVRRAGEPTMLRVALNNRDAATKDRILACLFDTEVSLDGAGYFLGFMARNEPEPQRSAFDDLRDRADRLGDVRARIEDEQW